ncbi:MAG: ABC transporter ATP-binding protein [Candidatus Kerfeldbacteria bacterium]|nr:ABC transporter ATP-binding protein [Candidatus Kerfeldbacteria bacterium]
MIALVTADIITVDRLTKRYGDLTAVDGISFSVRQGETFGILGPNGAGKTTTLEMIEGLKGITSGTAVLGGHDVAQQARTVKSLIGVQLQASSFFDGLNLKELIETFAALYGRTVDAMQLLRQVQLEEKWKSQVKELSGGQKQRLSIAVALVNDPKVLFLDEPTTGLDPQARRNLWDLISGIKRQGKTIILTTHYMEEAEVLCDRVAIMDHAKIVALDTPLGLIRQADVGSTVEFHVDRQPDLDALKQLPGVEQAVSENHAIRIITKQPEQTLPALFEFKAKAGLAVTNVQMHQATLEDVFLKLTGHLLRE